MKVNATLRFLWLNFGWPLILAVIAATIPIIESWAASGDPLDTDALWRAARLAAITFFATRFSPIGGSGAPNFVPLVRPGEKVPGLTEPKPDPAVEADPPAETIVPLPPEPVVEVAAATPKKRKARKKKAAITKGKAKKAKRKKR